MTELLAAVFSLTFVGQVLRIAVPYALAAMGGAVTERSGVIDLALEGKLLFGAFTAAAVGHATGSALLGRLHPVGVAVAGLFLGLLSAGGLAVGEEVPKELTEMLQGVVVLAIAAAGPWVRRRSPS